MAEPKITPVGGLQGITVASTEVKNPAKLIEFTSSDSSVTITPDAFTKTIDFSVSSLPILSEWQNSCLDRTNIPPISPNDGDRYLITSVASGYWVGKEDNIAEFNGTSWEFTSPTIGMFVAIDDELDGVYLYGGSSWTFKSWEQSTASNGLTKVGYDIRLDSSCAGDGLGFSSGVVSVNVDNTTIEVNSDTLRVKADGINDLHIDWGTGSNQVSAIDIPIADTSGYFTSTEVEGALAELHNAIPSTKKYFNIQVHKIRTGSNTMSNASWFDMVGGTLATGSYSGFGSSCQCFIVPYSCYLKKAKLIFRRINFDWRSTPGNAYFEFGFYTHQYNGATDYCRLVATIPGSFTGNNSGDGSFYYDITSFVARVGSNSFSSLATLGVQFRKDVSVEGQVFSIVDPIVLLEFEEL